MSNQTEKLYQIEKNAVQKEQIIIMNAIKMLYERGYINRTPEQVEQIIKTVTKTLNGKHIYNIPIDSMPGIDSKVFMLNYAPYKISSFNKSYGVKEFLDNNHNKPKIVVLSSIQDKLISEIKNNYPFTEIFIDNFLMKNIIDHEYVPRHILLSKEDGEQVRKEYLVSKKQLSRIHIKDPIARYYNMKIGDICKILRYSGESGYDIAYRIVVPGSGTL